MIAFKRPCPFCLTEASSTNAGDAAAITCACCGRFRVSKTLLVLLAHENARDPVMSAWLRSQYDAGHEPKVTTDEREMVRKNRPEYSVAEKQHLLLKWMASSSRFPGDAVKVRGATDWPTIWADGPDEFEFHLKGAAERQWLRLQNGDGFRSVELTAAGWERLDRTGGELMYDDRAFVAMAFSEELTEAWLSGFSRGINRAGYKAHRVDSEPHIQRIDQKIIGDIRSSRFIVADVTLHRPGVYFEAGYALALGRPVIWSVRKDGLASVHFDTRQFSHIVWTTPDDLAAQLENVVAGVIGRRAALG